MRMNEIVIRLGQWIPIGLCSLLLFFPSACSAENKEPNIQNKVKAVEQTSQIILNSRINQRTDFSIFWRSFRADILNKNFKSIAQKTRFPFTVRGVSDGDPLKQYQPEDFTKIMEQVLNQMVLDIDDQGNLSQKTLFEVIKLMRELESLPSVDQKHIQIKQFEFELIQNNWTFVQAYVE